MAIKTIEDFYCPLTWGETNKKIKERWGNSVSYCINNKLKLNEIWINNVPGDCGALTLNGMNEATDQQIEDVMELASNGGFSKLFATVVKKMTPKEKTKYKARFRALGWRCLDAGKSNRNPHKTDLIFIYINKNCNYKGY